MIAMIGMNRRAPAGVLMDEDRQPRARPDGLAGSAARQERR